MDPEEKSNVDQLIADLNSSGSDPDPKPQFSGSGGEPAGGTGTGDPGAPSPSPAMRVKEPFTEDKAKSMAGTWVKWFNSVLKLSFPWFYRKTILAKGDEEKMAAFVRKNRGKTEREMQDAISNDDTLWPVQTRFDRYMKALEAAPLSEEEMQFISEPLSELIIKYRWMQLGPEWSLVIAVFLVMLPRLEPVIPGLRKLFETDKSSPS
jgi:hypothetical protein